jgi:hypothetical protein
MARCDCTGVTASQIVLSASTVLADRSAKNPCCPVLPREAPRTLALFMRILLPQLPIRKRTDSESIKVQRGNLTLWENHDFSSSQSESSLSVMIPRVVLHLSDPGMPLARLRLQVVVSNAPDKVACKI